MTKTRCFSVNRMLVELIENGIEAKKKQEFFDLAERFRGAADLMKSNDWVTEWAGWCSAPDPKAWAICPPLLDWFHK